MIRADALDGLDAVLPALLHAGGQGEREGVEDEVLGPQAVAPDGDVVNGPGRPQLPFGGARLSLGVDARADDRRAELLGQGEERVEPGADVVPLFEVDRIDDGPAADPGQRGLDHRRLGRVDHQRHGRLGGEPGGNLLHVGDAVGARVVDAHVDQVRALLDLVTCHGHAGVPVLLEHRLAEPLRTVGVGALADHQEGGVLVEGNGRVDGGSPGLGARLAGGRGEIATGGHHGCQVGRGGAAAAADDRHAQFTHELAMEFGQLIGGEVVVHGPVDHRGQSGVGLAADRDRGLGRQVTQGLEHLGGPGRAVEADHVDVHRRKGDQRGSDLGTREHGAGELDGDLHLDGHLPARSGHGTTDAVDGRLCLQQVEHGLDDEQVDAPLEEGCRLVPVRIPEVGVADLAEGRELGPGPEVAGHPTRVVRCGIVVDRLAGEAGGSQVELVDPVLLAVLGQDRCECAEGVGLDDVTAHLEERAVDARNDVGAGHHQQLVAPFEVGATEVIGGQPGQLQVGPHGAVEDHDAFGDCPEVARFIEGDGHSPSRLPARECRWDGATGREEPVPRSGSLASGR